MKIIKFSPRMKNKFNIKRPYSILNREETFNNNSGVHWGIITLDIVRSRTKKKPARIPFGFFYYTPYSNLRKFELKKVTK